MAGGEALKIKGIPESPATDVLLERVDIQSGGFINLADARGVTVRDSRFEPAEPTLRLLDTAGVRFERCRFDTPDDCPITVEQLGEASATPVFDDCDPAEPLAD